MRTTRIFTRLFLPARASLAIAVLLPCALRAQRPSTLPDTGAITADLIEKGRRIYRGKGGCPVCHGAKLEGTAVAPAHLKTNGWKHAKDGTFGEIVRVVRAGVPNTLMLPSPNGISEDESLQVAAFVWAVNSRGVKP